MGATIPLPPRLAEDTKRLGREASKLLAEACNVTPDLFLTDGNSPKALITSVHRLALQMIKTSGIDEGPLLTLE